MRPQAHRTAAQVAAILIVLGVAGAVILELMSWSERCGGPNIGLEMLLALSYALILIGVATVVVCIIDRVLDRRR